MKLSSMRKKCFVRQLINIGCLSLILGISVQCKEEPVRITTEGFERTEALHLVENDLTNLMGQALSKENLDERFRFRLLCDTAFHNGRFSCEPDGVNSFVFRAGTPADVSHAVYTFLEKLGYTFDITSTLVPESFDFGQIRGLEFDILPKVRWRGIRQHVNFPMDISSYPIDEAKEYLNNLLRLRFNKLAVHSYPGFWHEQPQGDSILYGGNFFYDSPHYYKGNHFLKEHIRYNDSLFCIPEMEGIYFKAPLKSKKTLAWMRELLAYAKGLGFYIQFSFEPRQMTLAETEKVARHITDTYPMIDALELMTEEMGGWGATCTREEVENTLVRFWGKDVLNDSVLTSCIRDRQSDLNSLYLQLGQNMEAVSHLKKQDFPKELKLGIYCTTGYASAAYHLVRKMQPDVPVALMPSHGSDGVNRGIRKLVRTTDDLDATEIYSWIEFDGLMYLQQNAIKGINDLFAYTDTLSAANQLASVCFNHWRTCENRITARFASEASLAGSMPVDGFYDSYARRVGLDASLFGKIMTEINSLDSFATTGLGNIGFCWTGAWKHSGLFKWMNIENIDKVMAGYEAVKASLETLVQTAVSNSGKEMVALLENRVDATILYLKAFKVATGIRTVDESKMAAEDKAKVIEVCNNALDAFEQYIEKYAEVLPDRGSEGVMVSVWNAPMYGLKLIRERLAGVPLEDSWHNEAPVDSPPLPIHN